MSLTDINKHAESVEQFISDLAKAFREKRWVKILSLMGVTFALLLNPFGLNLLSFPKPRWYSYPVWGIATASFFVVAFLIALLTKHKEKAELPRPTSIIKGLLAYTNTKEDAEWFARLQRGSVLHDCLRFCLGKGSSFAILSGESGTGKTSFLQAGLSPNIHGQAQRAIYVKLTDNPPLDSIRQSLNGDTESRAANAQQTLLALLRQATRNDGRPLVLILDQFEQFFTQNKRKPARKSFIAQMAEWHKLSDSLPVKILISIRDDFADRMSEFQKEMDYTLTAHNKLRLEKFEPQEAAQVIGVIAREAKIELDEVFVKELTRHELADREEGTVSPVDIQILSWMLDGQKTSEERAFNRRAFQRLGGVEGLLERFLSRQLDARDTDARRQAVIKVMLALTDQNVRAGALSLKALKEKLSGVVPDQEVEEAVSWLARSEVRLITPVQEKNVTLYELAHERIITPLRRLAFKEISGVERAQQTLDRRVNEWIGNNRARRYLLTLREWRLIKRHWPLIRLASQKEQKEEFVAVSKGRFVIMATSFAAVLLLGFGAYTGYAWYEARPQTQLDLAQKRLVTLLNGNKDSKAMGYASLLLSVLDSQKDQKLSQELRQQINRLDHSDQAKVLPWLGRAYIKLAKDDEAVKVLAEAQREAGTLTSMDRKDALESLADAYTGLSKTAEAIKGLEEVEELGEKGEALWRVNVLLAVAKAYGKLSKCDAVSRMMGTVIQRLNSSTADPLSISILDSDLSAWLRTFYEVKEQCRERLKTDGLRVFQAAAARLPADERESLLEMWSIVRARPTSSKVILAKQAKQEPSPSDQIEALFSSTEESVNSSKPHEALRNLELVNPLVEKLPLYQQAAVLFALAEKYTQLASAEEAMKVLERVQKLAETDPSNQGVLLWQLAFEYSKLSKVDVALKVMEKAEAIEKPNYHGLEAFVEAYTKLSNADEATKGLDRIRKLVENLTLSEQADLLPSLAEAYGKFGKVDEATKTLAQAQQAGAAKSSDEKSLALAKVAAIYAKLGKWKEAVETAQSIGNEGDAVLALSRILIVSREAKDSTKYMDALEKLFAEITED